MSDKNEFKWATPKLQQQNKVQNGDIRVVNLPVQVVFEWSDKIVSNYDHEKGIVLEYTSGYLMKVLPNQTFVHNGENTLFIAHATKLTDNSKP